MGMDSLPRQHVQQQPGQHPVHAVRAGPLHLEHRPDFLYQLSRYARDRFRGSGSFVRWHDDAHFSARLLMDRTVADLHSVRGWLLQHRQRHLVLAYAIGSVHSCFSVESFSPNRQGVVERLCRTRTSVPAEHV